MVRETLTYPPALLLRSYFILISILSTCHIALFGQNSYEMVIEKRNGTNNIYNTNDIVNIYFREATDVSDYTPFDILDSGENTELAEGTVYTKTITNLSSSLPLLINSYAKYVGETVPTIVYKVGAYTSLEYTIGSSEFTNQQWRIPPVLPGMEVSVTINVPAGSTLFIGHLFISPENAITRPTAGVLFESHLGLQSYAPENTMAAYEAAALCGYRSCIVTPQVTSDEEIILYHSNTKCLTKDGGITKVGFSVAELATMTYAQILEYDVYKNADMAAFFDYKVPTLEQFLALCSRTGMYPTFSVHANYDVATWDKIKTLILKYGLGGKLSIKSPSLATLESAYANLGDLIHYNIYFLGINYASHAEIERACNSLDAANFASSNISVDLEIAVSDVTKEKVEYILSRGFRASVWNVFRHLSGTDYKTFMSYGISNFTDDVNCNNGLNW